MEQQAKYEAATAFISANTTNTLYSWDDHRDFMQGTIAALCCPSNAEAKSKWTTTHVANAFQTRTSYLMSFGDWVRANTETGTDYYYGRLYGIRGAFTRGVPHEFSLFSDGLSNTVAVSEGVNQEFGTNAVKGASVYVSNMASTYSDGSWPSSGGKSPETTCGFSIVTEPSDRSIYKIGGTLALHGSPRGIRMADGQLPMSCFTTVLPPNSPSCMAAASDDTWGLASPSSNHSGGVNVGFADGSVHFISETINCGNTSAFQTLTGPSPYGVWGALGTPCCGEPATL